jgi:tetratricopeptide (TPR) repeat protein
VAAVIERTFFYRILALVARRVGGIDEKITLLKEAQIILERFTMEEVEYQFKHALAQEAIYESILQQIRKELHLSVAQAIESIFAGRLGEFAGMLALHYTRGEDFDKAERYLIRAGEEALRSGASREAINHYRDALELYRSRQGEAADPATVAMLETNIARSLFYKGWYAEALPYYDRLQSHFGVILPRGKFAARCSAALALVKILAWLYMPQRRPRKPLTQKLREGFELSVEKGRMLTNYEQQSFVIQSSIALAQLLEYDVRDFETGLIILSAASAIFLVPGTSIALSRRVLQKMKPFLRPQLPRSYLFFLAVSLVHSYYAGEWEDRDRFRESLVTTRLGWESLWDIGCVLWTTCNICTERGDWDRYRDALYALEDALRRFPSDFDRQYMFLVKARYHMKRREAGEMSSAVVDLMSLLKENSFDVAPALSLSSRAALLQGNLEAAVQDCERAGQPRARSTGSVFVDGILLMAQAAVALERARRAAAAGSLDRETRRACLRAVRVYAKNARKFAPDLTESLRFLGSYWWHAGSRRRALRCWRRSIREGERLGARVDLAHTFADAGALLGNRQPGPAWRARGADLYRGLGL